MHIYTYICIYIFVAQDDFLKSRRRSWRVLAAWNSTHTHTHTHTHIINNVNIIDIGDRRSVSTTWRVLAAWNSSPLESPVGVGPSK